MRTRYTIAIAGSALTAVGFFVCAVLGTHRYISGTAMAICLVGTALACLVCVFLTPTGTQSSSSQLPPPVEADPLPPSPPVIRSASDVEQPDPAPIEQPPMPTVRVEHTLNRTYVQRITAGDSGNAELN